MRKDLLVVVLGFLIGAAALAVAQEEDEEALNEELSRLQEAVARLRHQRARPAPDRMPPLGERGEELRIYPVPDLVTGRPDYLAPHPVLDLEASWRPLFGGRTEEEAYPAGTIEEVMELVRSRVWPEAWEEGGMINAAGHDLLVVASPAVHADLARFLDAELRGPSHACATVEARVVDVEPALHRALAAGGIGLDAERQQRLDEALARGAARSLFFGRVTGFVGQRVYVWHGRQMAFADAAEVEVAKGESAANPVVRVLQAGGVLSVRASAGDDPGRLALHLEAALDEAVGVEGRAGVTAGPFETPRARAVSARTNVTVPDRTWALVGGGTRVDGGVRLLLVRATHLPRKGGAR